MRPHVKCVRLSNRKSETAQPERSDKMKLIIDGENVFQVGDSDLETTDRSLSDICIIQYNQEKDRFEYVDKDGDSTVVEFVNIEDICPEIEDDDNN